jgi:hypothetical protein
VITVCAGDKGMRVSTMRQDCCARCGAALRRRHGRPGQAWCDPCRRAGPDPRRDLPPGFYFQDPLAAALAEYDFRSVFRQIRMATGWSQQSLAEVAGLVPDPPVGRPVPG